VTAPPPGLTDALRDRYLLEHELGRGGMATVFLARDLKHDRLVALKTLHPEIAAALGTERFLQEIQLTARLQHPHILPLFDSGEAAGRLWYVMPYVEGETLRQRLAREKQLPVDDAIQIARNVLAALACAHDHGVVHRDIKPENILLERDQAVVADFGIAHAISVAGDERLTATGLTLGTPAYMSPEQAAGEPRLDARSDIYSLGCVVYEMLAGEPPFTGPTPQAVIAKRLAETPTRLRTVREAVSESLEHAVGRALARVPADRFSTADDFAEALLRSGTDQTARRSRRRRLIPGVVAALIAIAIGLLVRRPWSPGATRILDSNLLAVAPFEVLATDLELWREGLVDLLSRSLDGAGPLRTVSPTLVIHRWSGRADPVSAAELARRTGAGLALFGSLVRAGTDSVRLTATLLDVITERPIGEIELHDVSSRIDRLADSAAVGALRELGRVRPIGAVRQIALGARTLPVLRAFLRGEQFFRRTAWDSAMTHYERATALDSTFAVAWRRMGGVRGCGRIGFKGDPLALEYGLRAGALNRRLAPRDSLLVTADSLFGALFQELGDPAWREHHSRLYATLNEAVRRYPQDPEIWYELGDALFHWPRTGQTAPEQVMEAFDRAIALDSAFGPAYIHPIEIALRLDRPALARRYLGAYLGLNQTDPNSEGMELMAELLGEPPWPAEVTRHLDTASTYVLFSALWVLRNHLDSSETVLRVARAFFASRHTGEIVFDDSTMRRWGLARALAHRGHLREAYAVGDALFPADFSYLGVLGAAPAPRVGAVFDQWLRDARPDGLSFELMGAQLAAPTWWALRSDTASLRQSARRWESIAGGSRGNPELGLWASYGAASSQAYLALARGDTAEARRRFAALPDSVCPCLPDRIMTARLLAAAGEATEAATVLERSQPVGWDPFEPLWRLERGRVAERLGRTDEALRGYRYIADGWRHADPELRPYVAEARAATRRLTSQR